MNFFKLYIGDYQRDTAHLSVTEHGAYLLMLQHYYATEKPLPPGKALHRMLRAQDKQERDAIDAVASQFWKETPAGLINERADAELSKAGAQAETNARIAREREARRKSLREQHEESTNRATNDEPNQTPDTRHHSQTPDLDTHHQPSTEAGRVCLLMRRAGISDGNHGHPDLLTLIDAGATDAEFEQAAVTAVSKGKGFAYALGVLKGQRSDAAEAAKGMHRSAIPASPAQDRKARQLATAAVLTGVATPPKPQPETIDVDARVIAP